MTPVSDRSVIRLDLKWAVFLVGLLISAAGSAGVLAYQVSELRRQVAALETQQRATERATVELAVTLKATGVIK